MGLLRRGIVSTILGVRVWSVYGESREGSTGARGIRPAGVASAGSEDTNWFSFSQRANLSRLVFSNDQ